MTAQTTGRQVKARPVGRGKMKKSLLVFAVALAGAEESAARF